MVFFLCFGREDHETGERNSHGYFYRDSDRVCHDEKKAHHSGKRGYATQEKTANIANNFTPVKGKLSFTPSRGTADRYLVKQDIEVSVKANNF